MTPFERAARTHAESRGSRGTRDLYLADLTRWLLFCQLEGIDPEKPNLAAATKFRDELLNKVSKTTARHTCLAISAMYNNALDDEGRPIVPWNPFKKLQLPPAVKHGLTEVVSKEAADKLLAEAAKDESSMGKRDYALMQILYSTGLRVSSVVTLRRSDIFYRDEQMLIKVTVKGGKIAEVEVPESAEAAVNRWLDASVDRRGSLRWLFPARDVKKSLATKAVNKRFDTYSKLAGVGHIHPHQFRAAFITELIESGIPLHEVQAVVHHEDPKTTLRYHRGVRGAGVTAKLAELRKKREP